MAQTSVIRRLRIGTRASALARWQAQWVASRLEELGAAVELVPITTRGDANTAQPIGTISGGDGLFTKELQRALLADQIDLAVHSLKDLPTQPIEGLRLAAVPERTTTADVLVSRGGQSLADLPIGASVGTGSQRRRAQLLHARPDLVMRNIRGNVDTRLQKVRSGEFDALVLAAAGLTRLGLLSEATQILPEAIMLPAVGQGALGIECRTDDLGLGKTLAALDHAPSHSAILAERAMLSAVSGGCLAPVAALGRVTADGALSLVGVVLSVDGRLRLQAAATGPADQAVNLGRRVANDLLVQGAAELIAAARDA